MWTGANIRDQASRIIRPGVLQVNRSDSGPRQRVELTDLRVPGSGVLKELGQRPSPDDPQPRAVDDHNQRQHCQRSALDLVSRDRLNRMLQDFGLAKTRIPCPAASCCTACTESTHATYQRPAAGPIGTSLRPDRRTIRSYRLTSLCSAIISRTPGTSERCRTSSPRISPNDLCGEHGKGGQRGASLMPLK